MSENFQKCQLCGNSCPPGGCIEECEKMSPYFDDYELNKKCLQTGWTYAKDDSEDPHFEKPSLNRKGNFRSKKRTQEEVEESLQKREQEKKDKEKVSDRQKSHKKKYLKYANDEY